VILGSQRNSGVLRPGLIILLGVIAIALVLITILLLPLPNVRSVAERLIPPGTTVVSELNYGDLIGMSGSTEASLIDVAEFYRERFRLGRGPIVGGGISSWSEGRLFGRLRSGVTMPYTTEGFVILVRDKKELLVAVASRATNETATSVEIFCERAPKGRAFATTGLNRAISFSPPEGTSASSAASLFTQSTIFTSGAQFTNIITHCFTNVLGSPPVASTNWAVAPAGSGMVSIPKRTSANSATFVARHDTNQTVIIHCFRSANSTQTHVLVGSAMK
jgi:hypothetical protein